MKKSLVYLGIPVFITFLILFKIGMDFKSGQENNFLRKFTPQNAILDKIYNLPPGHFDFAGTDGDKIYLKNNTILNRVFRIDPELKRFETYNLNVSRTSESQKSYAVAFNNSLYIVNSKNGKVLKQSLLTADTIGYPGINTLIKHPAFYNEHIMFAKSAYFNKDKSLQRALVKVNIINGKITEQYKLPGQKENFYSNDGMMRYGITDKYIYYIYFYRGELLKLDSNLKPVNSIKTIDTITTVDLNVSKIADLKQPGMITMTQSKPAKAVNRNFVIYNNQILIMSSLKSDDETWTDFNENQVIDVYDCKHMNYKHSFYLPRFRKYKPKDFMLNEGYIYAIYDRALIRYKYKI